MAVSGETIARIEHKLDAILTYLKNLTGEDPIPLHKPMHGLNGLTNNVCPVTNTPVYLTLDPKTGDVVRSDGLSTGLVKSPIPHGLEQNSAYKPFMLSPAGTDSERSDD